MPETARDMGSLLEFYNGFKSTTSRISDALSKSDTSTDDLAQAIARLRQSLQDMQADLPAHDKRIYEQDLQQLENQIEALRKTSSSNSKFSFKRNAKKPRNTETKVLAKASDTPLPSHVATFDPSNLTLSSFTSQTITINSLPSLPTEPRALIISDIRQSLVDLRSLPSLLAFHASDISDSAILLPNVSGSVILHTLSKCVLVVQCQQFRMHTSRDTTILLNISSTPIIEASVGLRFGSLKEVDHPSCTPSRHHQVQDFDCPDADSPNWSPLDSNIETELNAYIRQPHVTLDALLPFATDNKV